MRTIRSPTFSCGTSSGRRMARTIPVASSRRNANPSVDASTLPRMMDTLASGALSSPGQMSGTVRSSQSTNAATLASSPVRTATRKALAGSRKPMIFLSAQPHPPALFILVIAGYRYTTLGYEYMYVHR